MGMWVIGALIYRRKAIQKVFHSRPEGVSPQLTCRAKRQATISGLSYMLDKLNFRNNKYSVEPKYGHYFRPSNHQYVLYRSTT